MSIGLGTTPATKKIAANREPRTRSMAVRHARCFTEMPDARISTVSMLS